jgi:hypothetical protein
MWIAGDALMFGLMMLIFLQWSQDERDTGRGRGRGWLEQARRANMARLVTGPDGQDGPADGSGPDWSSQKSIDDDEHLAAYNAYLARMNQPSARHRE